jgi:hypothetical protein
MPSNNNNADEDYRTIFYLLGGEEENEANSIMKNGFDCSQHYNTSRGYNILRNETQGLHFFNNMDLVFKYVEKKRTEKFFIISARIKLDIKVAVKKEWLSSEWLNEDYSSRVFKLIPSDIPIADFKEQLLHSLVSKKNFKLITLKLY